MSWKELSAVSSKSMRTHRSSDAVALRNRLPVASSTPGVPTIGVSLVASPNVPGAPLWPMRLVAVDVPASVHVDVS